MVAAGGRFTKHPALDVPDPSGLEVERTLLLLMKMLKIHNLPKRISLPDSPVYAALLMDLYAEFSYYSASTQPRRNRNSRLPIVGLGQSRLVLGALQQEVQDRRLEPSGELHKSYILLNAGDTLEDKTLNQLGRISTRARSVGFEVRDLKRFQNFSLPASTQLIDDIVESGVTEKEIDDQQALLVLPSDPLAAATLAAVFRSLRPNANMPSMAVCHDDGRASVVSPIKLFGKSVEVHFSAYAEVLQMLNRTQNPRLIALSRSLGNCLTAQQRT